jgi:hypothetical protein
LNIKNDPCDLAAIDSDPYSYDPYNDIDYYLDDGVVIIYFSEWIITSLNTHYCGSVTSTYSATISDGTTTRTIPTSNDVLITLSEDSSSISPILYKFEIYTTDYS